MSDDIDEETADLQEPEDRTVVVERRAAVDDRTVVVERRRGPAEDGPDDRTVVIDRGSPRTASAPDDEDRTVVVPRQRRGSGAPPAVPAADPVINLLPRRRGAGIAPVEPGAGARAVEPVGPNAVQTYVPRAIAAPPPAGPGVPRGEAALRAAAPSMPSVLRQSRRAGAVSLLVFAAACLVSAVGLIAVIVWFVRG